MQIGIIGGGIGGLAAAIALREAGHRVTVFEQAERFGRVGADINLTPNAVRALDGLGVGEQLRETAARPNARISRMWDTGEETSRLAMSDEAERQYGAPQLTMHRADVMAALEQTLQPGELQLGKRTVAFGQTDAQATVTLADGSTHTFDLLLGADGIHSGVRKFLFGDEHPQFTGIVSYRAVVPAERLSGGDLGAFVKWWGPTDDLQIVTFPLNRGRDVFIFATTSQADWTHESWTTPGDPDALRRAYANFHPQARDIARRVRQRARVGVVYSRSVAEVDRRTDGAARRRLPSDDAVHGARRGHGDRGCRRARAGAERRRSGRTRRGANAIRKRAARAHRENPDRLARQQLAENRRQCRLGLRLRCVDRAAGVITTLTEAPYR